MKKFVLLTNLFILLTATAFSQLNKGGIKGKVADSIGTTFSEATVVLVSAIDSSVVDTKMTDSKGEFVFKEVPYGMYQLFVTSVQFNGVVKEITVNSELKNMGTISVIKGYKQDAVTVVAQNPVRIAQDTVEFRADAFKTRPNAMVEDLLKKLPGVQVAKDGSVTAQGQTVTKIYVDGKQFFGDDPKMATKNLPANVIDKVQVIDKKSDQSQFTGFDDGTTEKVINITIKKDKKKGFFGRASVAAGTDNRYESNLSFNKFKNGSQLSIIGQANNTNSDGFTFQDIMDFNGSGGFNRGGGGDGGGGGSMNITTTRGGGGVGFGGQQISGPAGGKRVTVAGGINYANSFGKKVTLTSSYFVNNAYSLIEKDVTTQNLSLDSNFSNVNEQISTSRTWNTNHRLNFEIDYKIDSANSLLIRPSITYIDKESLYKSVAGIKSNSKTPKSDVQQNTYSLTNQLNFTGTLLWRHKTKVKGRTLSIRLNGSNSATDGDGTNYSKQDFYSPFVGTRLIDQINETDNGGNTLNTRISYTEPLSKTRILELFYVYGRTINKANRQSFGKDVLGNYTKLDTTLSNVFENKNDNQQIGFNIQTKLKKYDYSVGLGVQNANLNSYNVLKNTTLTQKNVINLFPTARLNYNLGKSRNLRFNYRGNTNQPSVNQLQPVVDNSNPLAIRQGNPALKQEFTNNINATYNKFNFITLKTFFTFFNFSATNNKIVDSIKNLGSGRQSITPTNASGAYNVIGNVSFSLPIKSIKTTNFNSGSSIVYNKDVNVTDGSKNFTKLLTITENIGINHNYKDKLDILLSSNVSYNNTKYTFNSNLNTEFYSFNTSFDISYTFKNNLIVQTDIDNNSYKGRSTGFNQNFTTWNGSISKLLLKDKSLELKLTAFDILKQNQSINRTVQANFIEDSRTNTLQQYFLVGLKYNLNKFGGKNAKTFSMPKIPGMRQMNNMRIGM